MSWWIRFEVLPTSQPRMSSGSGSGAADGSFRPPAGDTIGHGHAGPLGASSLGIATGQSPAFVMLGRFAFASVLSLWRSAGAFTLSHPWPFECWFGVRTSNFSEGLFRGKISPELIGDRLKCRHVWNRESLKMHC